VGGWLRPSHPLRDRHYQKQQPASQTEVPDVRWPPACAVHLSGV